MLRTKSVLTWLHIFLLVNSLFVLAPLPVKADVLIGTPRPITQRTALTATSPLPNIQHIAGGIDFTCALVQGGRVYCWGKNTKGQLGNGTTIDSHVPTPVINLGGVAVAVVAGGSHACALLQGGAVRCWGANGDGQLGDGTTRDSPRPVRVINLGGKAIALAAGATHTCALLQDGSVRCWGNNWYGQLGDGTTRNRSRPVRVANLGGRAVAITAGYIHTCALLQNGSARCWGNNRFGQLGIGSLAQQTTPRPVANLGGQAVAIGAGSFHTCALLKNGSVRCWGSNFAGQLGDGTWSTRLTPVSVVHLGGKAKALAVGGSFTCALLEAGRVRCWGRNGSGQLGNASTTDRNRPVSVLGLRDRVRQIAAGGDHACAVLEDRTARCWGSNTFGQLGNSSPAASSMPRHVLGLPRQAVAVAAGGFHACALLEDGSLRCWGSNTSGQLGDGTTRARFRAARVVNLGGRAIAVTAGWGHTCAVREDGAVFCWGSNFAGQLGDGTTQERHTPVRVRNLGGQATAVVAGNAHTCALLRDGSVRCWGINWTGQLGNGTTQNSSTPVRVVNLGGKAVALAAGNDHTCALLQDGSVRCWGDNSRGQLGDNTQTSRNRPVQVVNLGGRAKSITAGTVHTCAVLTNGKVRCWGDNAYGQLGDGTTISRRAPVNVVGLGSVTAVAAGARHTCALLGNGALRCWGANGLGQLGNGDWGNSPRPVPVPDLTAGVTAVTAGQDYTCALVTTATTAPVLCWGWDGYGQLGRARGALQRKPVPVLNQTIPEVRLNYRTGRPGSWFTLWAWNFPPNAAAQLLVNGRVVRNGLRFKPSGEMVLFLSVPFSPGEYLIEVRAGTYRAQTVLRVDNRAPLRPREGDGFRLSIPNVSPRPLKHHWLPIMLW